MKVENVRAAERGFTLIEVVVGLTLLVMVLGSGFSAYMIGIELNKTARNTLRATQFAESKMEEIRTKNWSDLESMDSVSIFYADTSFAANHMDDFIGLLQIYEHTADQKRIRCWVWWPDEKGSSILSGTQYTSAFFESIFTKNGLNDYFVRAF